MTHDPDYPRPQLVRDGWLSLDGSWEFAFSDAATPEAVAFDREIRVPFAPETPLSGVADPSYHPRAWYQREFTLPSGWAGRRVLLHFGAVDYRATVWVNGRLVATHTGGHTPFSADVTDALTPEAPSGGAQTVAVLAEDDPHELDKPRGKQDWLPEAHSIWYPRTTGIWQTVWLEAAPATRLESLRLTPDWDAFAIRLDAEVIRASAAELDLTAELRLGDELLAAVTARVGDGGVSVTLPLPDPGIDDARNRFLWSPENPTLLDLTLELRSGQETLDRVRSYTAMRHVSARDGRFELNGRPYFLRLVLDQGYWCDGGLTAPSPQALRRDVELTKRLGFNGARKHQKVEDPRYLYWADRLGLLVWTEMPSAYRFTERAATRLTREWLEVVARDRNHPSVVAWVPFNESWGVPDLPDSAPQRHLVQALYHLTKALDPTRPVSGNDGWEQIATDLLTIHDYSSDPELLRCRYADPASVSETIATFRPGGRRLTLPGFERDGQPVILSEFGGARLGDTPGGWGYDEAGGPEELLEKYRALTRAAHGAGLAGFCYTQLTDTFQEQNGLLTMDRTPKVAMDRLAAATRGEG